MDEPQRPAELSEEAWQATPLEVRLFLALLTEKIAALEARLNQTSQNSSKPPSSDPPSAPSRPAKTPRGKPKNQGAQPGHPDQQRELLPHSQVDEVVEVHPTCCPGCQSMLPATLRSVCLPQRQQVWELPEIKPTVTEFQYRTVCCPECHNLVTATRPAEVPPGAFGPRVAALIALLHGRYRISNRELVSLLQMVWLLPISLGSVVHLQEVASEALAPAQVEVQQAVEQSEHANADETSWREGKLKPYLWVAVTAVATLFLIQYGRGKEQLRALIGTAYAGLVTSDRLRAYNSLEPKRRQLCWAHIVRNLRARAEAVGKWQAEAQMLLALAEEVLVIWGDFRDGSLDRATMQGMVLAIQQAMWELVERGKAQKNTYGSMCADLAPRWEALWTFLSVEGVEPTNNAAERALRPAVLWRKGCYGTQSAAGSRFVERMLTVSATCQQHQRPLLPYLVEAVSAHWGGQPAPKLLLSAIP